ncbi:MAG: ribokinase [Pseudomonadota bacterium]
MIFNLGSINIDGFYQLNSLPGPGETVAAHSFMRHLGGKGINQSIAAHLAGGSVHHIGAVGGDGDWVIEQIKGFGLNTSGIETREGATGHAVVAVDGAAENQIIIFGGTNQTIAHDWIASELVSIRPGDFALCQNETNLTIEFAALVSAAGAKLVLSAAPFDADQVTALRDHVHLLAVNESEAAALSEVYGAAPSAMGFPIVVVTEGSKGASVYVDGQTHSQDAFDVDPVDTTGAGDTFLGSFVARLDLGDDIPTALQYASAASAIQVTRPGAAAAIPSQAEVAAFLKEHT